MDEVTVFDREGIVEIAVNRPAKRNALTRSLLADFLAALKSIPDETRLVILSSRGAVFCAGMDLREMEQAAAESNPAEIWKQDAQLYRDVVETLFCLACPTLCLVQGPVLAGGVGLVLACDLVVAAESARFELPEPKRGITASIVLPLLRYRVGNGPAGFFLLSGLHLSAQDAMRFGLVHRMVPDAQLDSVRDELSDSIRQCAPLALQSTKRQLNQQFVATLRQEWDVAMKISAEARGLPEAREGLQAFLEHRLPNWVSTKEDS